MKDMKKEQVENVLEQIRPSIKMDGGDLELVDIDQDTGVVQVRLKGACVGCPMANITLKMGIEAALQDAIPEVTKVIAVEAEA